MLFGWISGPSDPAIGMQTERDREKENKKKKKEKEKKEKAQISNSDALKKINQHCVSTIPNSDQNNTATSY